MFGAQFKKLRKEQHISLTKAAENVTTPSTLSRWENGQSEMRFDQVLELLNNIHISPLEFISITSLSGQTPFIEEVYKAYTAKNSFELKHLYSDWINIYNQTLNIDSLFNAAISASFFFQLTEKKIMSSKYVDVLETTFSDISYWNHYYITRFGNCLDLLSTNSIYGLSVLIINNLDETKKSGYEYFIDTVDTLLNALIVLIDNDINKATKLSKKIDTIHLSQYSLYLDMRKQFLEAILIYKTTGNKHRIIEMINCAKILHRQDIYNNFIETLNLE